MSHVLTLVAPAPDPEFRDLVAAVGEALGRAGARVREPDFLAPDAACDLPFEGAAVAEVESAAREAAGGRAVDLAAQPVAGRRKKLLVADMDSTIVTCETLDELAAHAGVKDRVEAITEAAMRGEIDFRGALRERVAMLAGLPESALSETYRRAVRLTPGAEILVRTMRAGGARTALISGGFTYFTDRVASQVGFDEAQANRLEMEDGRLTGRVRPPIINRDGKRTSLVELCIRLGIDFSQALAVGDGANDLPMLQTAGLGVAFHAKPVVAETARVRIDHADLTALLYLQGYRREAFRT